MYIAKAMSLGGKLIYAEKCNYDSYINLGLRCTACGEPVHLRNGDYRQPHFAHFKGTDPRQVEECNLRASAYGNSTHTTQECWNKLYESKGQRLEIFQNYFINIIASSDSGFYNKIQTVKDKFTFNNDKLEAITARCTKFFIQSKESFKRNINKNDSKITFTLEQQIKCEAIDYLCVKSSYSLLTKLIHYSLYKLFNQQPYEICKKLVEIIINISWLKSFSQLNSFDNSDNTLHVITPKLSHNQKRKESRLAKRAASRANQE